MKNQQLIKELLKGAFIAKRPNRRKGFGYALYNNDVVILSAVSDKQYKRFDILYKERRGRVTLNLNTVRQQHGKSLAKALYKEFKKSKL